MSKKIALRRKKSVIGLPPPSAQESVQEEEQVEDAEEKVEETAEPKVLAPKFDFSKFTTALKTPHNFGITNRVDKILSFLKRPDRSMAAPIELTDAENWKLERTELEEKIADLERELEKIKREGIVERIYVEVGRPGGDVAEEVALLRQENLQLRNSANSRSSSGNLVALLRKEIEELKAQNTELRHQLAKKRDENSQNRPPSDLDLGSLPRLPLELNKVEKARVFEVLENEWKESCANSRHAGADPLRNPFDRRRFGPPAFPTWE